ncbi:hypothetical protein BH09ACT3_BH09ACT3_02070 [soil metagenome]
MRTPSSRQLSIIAISSVALALGGTTAALADNPEEVDLGITVEEAPDLLTLSFDPDDANFLNEPLDGAVIEAGDTSHLGAVGRFYVNDQRPTRTGWDLRIGLTPFVNSEHPEQVIPVSAIGSGGGSVFNVVGPPSTDFIGADSFVAPHSEFATASRPVARTALTTPTPPYSRDVFVTGFFLFIEVPEDQEPGDYSMVATVDLVAR